MHLCHSRWMLKKIKIKKYMGLCVIGNQTGSLTVSWAHHLTGAAVEDLLEMTTFATSKTFDYQRLLHETARQTRGIRQEDGSLHETLSTVVMRVSKLTELCPTCHCATVAIRVIDCQLGLVYKMETYCVTREDVTNSTHSSDRIGGTAGTCHLWYGRWCQLPWTWVLATVASWSCAEYQHPHHVCYPQTRHHRCQQSDSDQHPRRCCEDCAASLRWSITWGCQSDSPECQLWRLLDEARSHFSIPYKKRANGIPLNTIGN